MKLLQIWLQYIPSRAAQVALDSKILSVTCPSRILEKPGAYPSGHLSWLTE
jgi:hypothetical protein